ncbi:MAG TPA: fibronectin type III domain-containing protein [Polyangiaceae bacterium]|nr:fibronectin type III domain-containing protein [Polyangiaceae bacterium]
MRISGVLLLMAATSSGCSSSDSGSPAKETAPAAPSELKAAVLSGGAHLTWKDNSNDEENFMILRMQTGVDTAYKTIATQPFDTVQYHDAPLTSGATYMYKIMAMNGAGESESNEAMLVLP